jgi:hypothetical protein
MAHRHGRRMLVNRYLDRLRFFLDGYPAQDGLLGHAAYTRYQPLPWLGRGGGVRAQSTYTRWSAIESALADLPRARTARDIGCNAGFFTVSLALQGIDTVGIEPDPVFARTAQYVVRQVAPSKGSIWSLELRPSNISLLPSTDITVFLSVWHHFVRLHGLSAATEMLRTIWGTTRLALFFESGEDDVPKSFGLPEMTPTPREWLAAFLARECETGVVLSLGEHEGFYGAPRTLFAVVREPVQKGGIET